MQEHHQVSEKLRYRFDLTSWLEEGESINSITARLIDAANGQEISGAISDLAHASTQATLLVDWAIEGIKPANQYQLFIKAGIGLQFKEGFARFATCSI